ncbi:MAG: hypothetical protein WCQ16_06805 [Verrucomicrobiae bacterium]
MIEKTTIQPAIVDLSAIIKSVKTAIEKQHKVALAKLRADHKAWLERARAISGQAIETAEAELIEAWEKGEIAPSEILTRPAAESMQRRLHFAAQRIGTYADHLDRRAAPITADVLEQVADGIERDIYPQAIDLDRRAKRFGDVGGVGARVLESCIRHRNEAAQFREPGKDVLALSRLADFLDFDE